MCPTRTACRVGVQGAGGLPGATHRLLRHAAPLTWLQLSNLVKPFSNNPNNPNNPNSNPNSLNPFATTHPCPAPAGVSSFADTNKVLAISRIMVAWQPVGLAMGAYDMCARYLSQRRQFGAPLAAFQLMQVGGCSGLGGGGGKGERAGGRVGAALGCAATACSSLYVLLWPAHTARPLLSSLTHPNLTLPASPCPLPLPPAPPARPPARRRSCSACCRQCRPCG